ncbi:MAG: cysteine desulfurase family protein, partial [Pseudomonadota bacterium]
YLDYNATTPLRPGVRDVLIDALDQFGNPSSVHAEGRTARSYVSKAKTQVAKLVGGSANDIVFCSSATEALNMVVQSNWDSVITLQTEHAAVLSPAKTYDTANLSIEVTNDGIIDLEALPSVIDTARMFGPRVLVCVQAANNETGVLQPVADVVEICRAAGASVLTDAVQVAGKLPIDVTTLGVDYAVISAHKLGGPKGVGALWVRPGLSATPLITGGGQEKGLRGGTENVASIAAFGFAAECAVKSLETEPADSQVTKEFERRLVEVSPDCVVIGRNAPRLPNTTSIAMPGRGAETLVIALDLAGFAVSAGAACSSGKVSRSHVIEAMGLGEELSASAIRISRGWETTQDDLDRFVEIWARTVKPSNGLRHVA